MALYVECTNYLNVCLYSVDFLPKAYQITLTELGGVPYIERHFTGNISAESTVQLWKFHKTVPLKDFDTVL